MSIKREAIFGTACDANRNGVSEEHVDLASLRTLLYDSLLSNACKNRTSRHTNSDVRAKSYFGEAIVEREEPWVNTQEDDHAGKSSYRDFCHYSRPSIRA